MNYQTVSKYKPMIFSDLITEDLESKRAFAARFPCKCSKCDNPIAKDSELYFYGKGRRICRGCHLEAIDWMKMYLF